MKTLDLSPSEQSSLSRFGSPDLNSQFWNIYYYKDWDKRVQVSYGTV